MNLLVISASLNPGSNSRLLAREARRALEADGVPVSLLDLRELPLPLCDGDAAYDHPNVARARGLIAGAAGGDSSYMSIMALANSLMLDFRCVIVPRFVYATDAAFADGALRDPEILARVAACARATVRLAGALPLD